jgi:OmpR-family two-component system manganese-sensing sensor histidine kinase
VIQTQVQVALEDPDPQLQTDQLRVLERLTRRLGRLVDDLLFLARQDSGMTPLQLGPVQLDELATDVLEEQQAIATEKGVVLSLHLASSASPETAYCIQGDRNQLTRLLTNLVSNAVQYTPAAGQVEVLLQRTKHQGIAQVQIQVKDTGIGIPAESIPHLFDRFYRVDPARKNPDTGSGSGLGLAIVKVIVENHQGQIQVESTPNQGTKVTVTLPYQRVEALPVVQKFQV